MIAGLTVGESRHEECVSSASETSLRYFHCSGESGFIRNPMTYNEPSGELRMIKTVVSCCATTMEDMSGPSWRTSTTNIYRYYYWSYNKDTNMSANLRRFFYKDNFLRHSCLVLARTPTFISSVCCLLVSPRDETQQSMAGWLGGA